MEFESGEKHIRMKEECEKIHAADLRTIGHLEKENAKKLSKEPDEIGRAKPNI